MDRLKSYKNKTFIQNMITIGMVVACYAVIQVLIATGNINSLMKFSTNKVLILWIRVNIIF